jgi:GNAT superfamily N-acetyltransferase
MNYNCLRLKIARILARDTYGLREEVLWPGGSVEDIMVSGDEDESTAHFGVFALDESDDARAIGTIAIEGSLGMPIPATTLPIPYAIAANHAISEPNTPIAVISLFLDPNPTGVTVDKPVSSFSSRDEVTDTSIRVARFRKFATKKGFQGRGIGSLLLEHTMAYAREVMKVQSLWCAARVSSQTWYEKRGLEAFGDTWSKKGVDYIAMQKKL